MATQDDIDDALAENAAGPRRVQVGNHSVEQHSIKDQIDASKHVASQRAKSRSDLGIRTRQITPVYP